MKNFNLLKFAIGDKGIEKIRKSKIIFSSLVYSKDFSKGANIILKNKNTPYFVDDWTVYKILRSICKTWIVTGQIMRDERELNILNNLDDYFMPEISEALGFRAPEIKTKKIFFFSKSINSHEITTYECFQEKNAVKYVLQNSDLSREVLNPSFLRQNNIRLLNHLSYTNFNNLSKYIINRIEDSTPILAEIGPKTLNNVLSGKEGKSQIDFMLISVYNGDLNLKFIGDDFPSLMDLTRNNFFELIHKTEPLTCLTGNLTFYTFAKKS
jgi:hypothetical protein